MRAGWSRAIFLEFLTLDSSDVVTRSKVQKFLGDLFQIPNMSNSIHFVPFLRIIRKEYDVVMHMVQCFPRKERSVTIFVR